MEMCIRDRFIDEQVEEEKTAQEYIDTLSLIGDNGYGLYLSLIHI